MAVRMPTLHRAYPIALQQPTSPSFAHGLPCHLASMSRAGHCPFSFQLMRLLESPLLCHMINICPALLRVSCTRAGFCSPTHLAVPSLPCAVLRSGHGRLPVQASQWQAPAPVHCQVDEDLSGSALTAAGNQKPFLGLRQGMLSACIAGGSGATVRSAGAERRLPPLPAGICS